jgi:hypothetical protein
MTRRWRSLLMLWLALCLPLQGFAAASGLWCAKMGFHAPAWAVAAAEHAAHGAQPAGVAATANGLAQAVAPADAPAAPPCHAGEPAPSAGTPAPHSGAHAGAVHAVPEGSPAADASPDTTLATACAYCAGCHASAVLPAATPAVAAGAPGTVLAPCAPTPHAGPWPQGLDRPPRTLLA